MTDDPGMASPKLINVGTPERPKWMKESLVWSRTFQSEEDHRSESIASGSVLPDDIPNKVSGTSNEQKP